MTTSDPSRPCPAHIDKMRLVLTWRKRIQNLKMAHYESCGKYELSNKVMGTIVIVLSAAVAPATYLAEKFKLTETSTWALTLVLLALSAGVLATLQIFFRDSERAEKHRSVGATYAKLEMDIELLATFPPSDLSKLQESIESFRDEWQRLTGQGPVIPADIYALHAKEIEGPPCE